MRRLYCSSKLGIGLLELLFGGGAGHGVSVGFVNSSLVFDLNVDGQGFGLRVDLVLTDAAVHGVVHHALCI